MSINTQSEAKKNSNQSLRRGMAWYYAGVAFLIVASFLRVSKTVEGPWTIDFGVGPATSILVALAILPSVLKFLVSHTKAGKMEVPGVVGVSWVVKEEIDRQLDKKQAQQQLVAEAAKDSARSDGDVMEARGDAEVSVENTVEPQDLSVVHTVYFQELIELIKAFNRNRHLRQAGTSTVAEADRIVYRMRSMAPLVLGQIDIAAWLNTPNLGKQIAAIKYLDWVQDIDFAQDLAFRVNDAEKRRDTFQAFHILLALLSMADQLAYESRKTVRESLSQYQPSGSDSSARQQIRDRIRGILA